MKNPKDWQATPHNYHGKNDKSGGTHWDNPKKNGDRPHTVAATSHSHFAPTPISSDGYKKLGNKSTMMGAPYAKSSDRTEMKSGMGMPAVTKKSKPDVAADPKSWKRKNYTMGMDD